MGREEKTRFNENPRPQFEAPMCPPQKWEGIKQGLIQTKDCGKGE